MIEIKDLLGRFNNILLSENGRADSVRNIISEIIKVEIKPEYVKIKNGVIYLNIKPIYKNEILLKRERILLKLEETFGKKIPKEIR
jgi:hypothetical protein